MTVQRRPHVGWEVVCDARSCQQTTAHQAPAAIYRKSSDAAVEAARILGWLSLLTEWRTYWVCPLHQTYDVRIERWVVNRSALPRTKPRTQPA